MNNIPHRPGRPKVVTWLMRISNGSLKEKEATGILVAASIVFLVLSVYLFSSAFRTGHRENFPKGTSYEGQGYEGREAPETKR